MPKVLADLRGFYTRFGKRPYPALGQMHLSGKQLRSVAVLIVQFWNWPSTNVSSSRSAN
jgi:hypothetical protein